MANMAHVGPGETFSWPPPGQTAPPTPPGPRVVLGQIPSRKQEQSRVLETRLAPWRPCWEVSSPPGTAGSKRRTTHPCQTPGLACWVSAAPVGGCAVAASSCAGSYPLLRPEPSGIFNWKLISPRLNRRTRQRRGTHPPAQPSPPSPPGMRRSVSLVALHFNGEAASVTLREHILIF